MVCPLRPVDEAIPGRRWILVAGAHRLQACRELGWDTISAVVTEMDEPHRQLAECDENLFGTRLKPAARAMLTQRRKEVYEAIHPETRNGATGNGRKKDRQNGEASRFSADTAAQTGKSERAVQRDAKRGSMIEANVLEAIRGTCLDKGKTLDDLAATPRREQAAKLLQLKQARSLDAQKRTGRIKGNADETGDGSNPGSAAAWVCQALGHANALRLAEILAHEHLPDFLTELRTLTGWVEPVVASGPISERQDNARAHNGSEKSLVSVTSEAAADPTPGVVKAAQAKAMEEPGIEMEPSIEPAGQSALMAEPARRAEATDMVAAGPAPPPDGGERRPTFPVSHIWPAGDVEPQRGAHCRECETMTWWTKPGGRWRCAGCYPPPDPRPTGYKKLSTGL